MSDTSSLISCGHCGNSVLILLNHVLICGSCGKTVRSSVLLDNERQGEDLSPATQVAEEPTESPKCSLRVSGR